MTDSLEPEFLPQEDGERIAYLDRPGEGTGVVWLGGFNSDMFGTKAQALDEWAEDDGRPFVRFDYFGHGLSSGDPARGTVSRWCEDTLTILDEVTEGPQILVGSSMGAWIALLAARERPEKIRGLVLVAPAADFTEDLMWAKFPAEVKRTLESGGVWERSSPYGPEKHLITMDLIADGRENLVLRAPLVVDCPVRILHGMGDADVPWERSLKLAEQITTDDVTLTFVKNGDHRLSDDLNLARLIDLVESLAWELEEEGE
ncbi:MAG: alpha/beta hydrolase [Alphaproteobacteria bacterium]